MEKLLNLLNEYMFVDTSVCEHLYNKDVETIYVRTTLETGEIDDERVRDEWIISKRFGFIKWLVDNDKIDKSKYERILDRIEYYSQSEEEQERYYYSDYESLLMLLAISDSPLKFLCKILK